jgi:large subunit ribosomal protein L9
MKTMEVLLRENIYPLGKCGDVVRVKAGYARNYLLPERLATFASEDNLKAMARRRLRLDAEEAEREVEIETRVKVLGTIKLEATMRADETGRLYGSVNPTQVVELLGAQGKEVEPKDVHIDTPIKSVGTHSLRLHVHAERYAEITIDVLPEGGMPVPAVEAPVEAASE